MEQLLEDYKRRLKTAEDMLSNQIYANDRQELRIKIKASCYRTFISELERAIEQTPKG